MEADTITQENDLEPEGRDPKQIALAAFRFRARRGIGVFYTLVSLPPLLASIMTALHTPGYLTLTGIVVCLIIVWMVARAAGMKGFYHMTRVIDLYNGKLENKKRGILHMLRGLLIFVLPFAVFTLLNIYGLNYLAATTIFCWVAVWVFYHIFVTSRASKDAILQSHIEDWLASPLAMVILILASLPGVPSITFAFATPVLIAAGIKSMYEAPQELVRSNE